MNQCSVANESSAVQSESCLVDRHEYVLGT